MKSFRAYISYGIKGHEEYRYNLMHDYTKEEFKNNIDFFINKVKENFPKAEFVDVLIETTPKYDKKLLMNVGEEVASNWGASCIGVKCFPNSVEFKCIEHGDVFTTLLSYQRIEEKYKEYLK